MAGPDDLIEVDVDDVIMDAEDLEDDEEAEEEEEEDGMPDVDDIADDEGANDEDSIWAIKPRRSALDDDDDDEELGIDDVPKKAMAREDLEVR
jgi:hypothetical protein